MTKAIKEMSAAVSRSSGTTKIDWNHALSSLDETHPLYGLIHARKMSTAEFIAEHASATLRNAATIPGDVATMMHYLEERAAFEFGYTFKCLDAAAVLVGRAISEGDVSPVSKAFSWGRRYINRRRHKEDKFEIKFVQFSDDHGKHEGIGIVCLETSAPWVPEGKIIFCLIAEYDTVKGAYRQAEYPF